MFRCRLTSHLLLVLALCLAACGAEDATGDDGLTEARLRELLPEAASVDPKALKAVARLGALVTPQDVGNDAALPLLVTTVYLPREWPPPTGAEAWSPPPYTPADVVVLLVDNAWTKAHGRPTLLSPEHVKSVTIEQEGARARGVVSFGPKDGFTGEVRYEAVRAGSGWAITTFELPKQRTRIVRKDGRWHVDKMTPPPAPLPLTLPHAPHVDAPPPLEGLMSVYVLPSGDIRFDGQMWPLGTGMPEHQAASLNAFETALAKREGLSGVAIVSDGNTRWDYPVQLLATCGRAGVDTTYLVAKSATGDGVGVLRVRPPGPTKQVLAVEFRRRDAARFGKAYTRIQVGDSTPVDLPRGWDGREMARDRAAYDAAMRRVLEAIRVELGRSTGGRMTGAVHFVEEEGLLVPVEDVVFVIGLLQMVGVEDVRWPGVERGD